MDVDFLILSCRVELIAYLWERPYDLFYSVKWNR